MDHKEKVLLWTCCRLERLKRKGLLSGGCAKITPKGRREFRAMCTSGFEPTTAEIQGAVDLLQSQA